MKKQFNPLLGGLALSASVLALSALWVSEASAQIANTRHNLGTTSTDFNRFTGVGTELCVFCHTPHGGATGASVPLWNKALPTGTAYTVYNSAFSSTIQGQAATGGVGPGGQIGSVSLACLSCHDGTQAMNNFINAPGSGNYVAGGTLLGTAAPSSTRQTMTAGGLIQDNNGFIPNLGTNLQNDHPIGIAYCGGSGTTDPSVGTQCPDSDFRQGATNVANNGGTGAARAWWVEKRVGGTAGRQKDDFPLYTRPTATGNQPMVECGSCHDPHTINATFLRIPNTNSDVCLTCHVK